MNCLTYFQFKTISITLVGPQCDNCLGFIAAHRHALTASVSSLVWKCAGCNHRYSKSHTMFSCVKDNFTLCTKCVLLGAHQLSIKHHKHSVAPVKPASDWMCSLCQTEPPVYIPRFQCTKGCAFEICGKCLHCYLEVVRVSFDEIAWSYVNDFFCAL